jgi:hypothetical protein
MVVKIWEKIFFMDWKKCPTFGRVGGLVLMMLSLKEKKIYYLYMFFYLPLYKPITL